MTNCANCKEKCNHEPAPHVPYTVKESCMARRDRTIKRLAIALAVVSVTAFLSNIFCIYMLKTREKEKPNEAIIVCEDK